MLDTRLKTFLILLEEKNYTKAAKRLYISQPAVTQHIKSLEKDYNMQIFKDGKNFELTSEGKLLKEYADIANQQYAQFETALLKKENKTAANIAITPSALTALNDVTLQQIFNTNHIYVNLYEYDYNKIVELLANGKMDFAIIDHSFDSQEFDSFCIQLSKVVLVCKKDGKYDGKDRMTRDMLANATLALGECGSGLYNIVMESLSNKNIRLKHNLILYSNNPKIMLRQILNYDAVGFMYEDSLKHYLDYNVKIMELTKYNPSQNIYFIYSRKAFLNNSTLSFIEELKSKVK